MPAVPRRRLRVIDERIEELRTRVRRDPWRQQGHYHERHNDQSRSDTERPPPKPTERLTPRTPAT
jgi:hypothetical protein